MIRRGTLIRRAMLATAVFLASCGFGSQGSVLGAESEQSTSAAVQSMGFRRVFVPADSPEQWPVDGQRYLPITSAEFSRLVRAKQAASQDGAPAAVRLQTAEYRARLRSDEVMQITAELRVGMFAEEPKLLELSPLNVSVRAGTWLEEPNRRVAVGLWQQPSGALVPAVEVERPGTLRLQGLLAPTIQDTHRSDYLLQLPEIVPQRFELTIPATHSADISHAQLLGKQDGAAGETVWSFQLAPQAEHQVRIHRTDVGQAERVLPFASQATQYEIDATGMQIVTQLRIDATEASSTTLRAALPAGMSVVGAALNQQPAEWEVVFEQQRQILVIEKPESLAPQELEVRCLSELHLGSEWELPKLRFENLRWKEGTSRIVVTPELEILALTPRQCALQHVVGLTAETDQGEVYRMQDWSDRATVEIQLARPQPQVKLHSLTKIELAQPDTRAHVRMKLSNSQGNVFQLRAIVAPGWEVESVQSTPSSALREWHIDRGDSSSTLRCQLTRPISAGQDFVLEVQARRSTGKLSLPASVGECQVLRFLDADPRQAWLCLSSEKTEQLVLANRLKHALLTPPEQLATVPKDLLGGMSVSSTASVLDLSRLGEEELIKVRQQPVEYSAELEVQIDVQAELLRHRYALDFSVDSGAVSEILLESRVPFPAAMPWRVVGKNVTVSSEQLGIKIQVESRTPGFQQYRLKLSEPLSTDFQLTASYTQKAEPLERGNLVNLPETLRWSGRLLVRGALEGLEFLDQGLTPITPSVADQGLKELPILGTYRLSPIDFRRNSQPASLRVSRLADETTVAQLIAWSGEHQTVQSANGVALHAANYYLESTGERELTIELPESAELMEVWLNHQQMDIKKAMAAASVYEFDLGQASGLHFLSLRYSTEGPALGGSAKLRPVLPKCSFPVKLSRWTLWAPEQYEIDKSQHSYSPQKSQWWKRAFGPLARARHETLFNPLSRAGWDELWSAPLAIQNSKQSTATLASELSERIQREPGRRLSEVVAELTEQDGLDKLVCIDRAALLAREITSQTPCSSLSQIEPARGAVEVGAKPLSSYDLALIASPGAIVLTTAERVAHWSDQLRPTRVPGVHLVTSDELSEGLALERQLSSPNYLSASGWLAAWAESGNSWQTSRPATLADVGRQAQTVEFTDTLPTLVVREANVQQALWYAVLLFSLVLGVWQLAHFPNVMIIVGAVAGTLCLIVPSYWLTIPQAVFLGLLSAALVRVVIKSSELGEAELDYTLQSSGHLSRVVFLIAILLSNTAFAAEAAVQADATASAQALQKVFVPIDSQGVQAGTDVFVSEQFLESLQSVSSPASAQSTQVAIVEASYDAHLPLQNATTLDDTTSTASRLWTFRWKLETRLPNQTLQLPLRQDEASWDSSAILLDGLPVKLQWHGEQGCSVQIPETGTHWLEVACLPKVDRVNQSQSIRLHVPSFPGATLNLSEEDAVRNLRVAGAALLTKPSATKLRKYVIGPSEVLEVRWQTPARASSVERWSRLEQSSWLTIDGATAQLDVQFHIVGNRGKLQTLNLNFSDQLRLVEPPQDSPVQKVVVEDATRPSRVQLQLRPNLPSEVIIPLKFELLRTSSIGQVYFPRVRLVGSVPELHRFAVSVASGLSYDERGAGSLRTLEPKDFLESWEGEASTPLFAYALNGQAPNWSLKVWPDPNSFRAQQRLRLHCGMKQVDVEFEADVSELTGTWHMHRLRVPEGLAIEGIVVREQSDDSPMPLRWSRMSPTEVSVFLGRPIRTTHQITMQGYLQRPETGLIDIPQIRLLGSDRGQMQMELSRSEAVQVSWVDARWSPAESPSPAPARTVPGFHVGSYSWRIPESSPLSKLLIRENEVSFAARSLTTIEQAAGGWRTTLSSRIAVEQGVLSRLRISVPQNVRAPYKLLPEQVGVIRKVVETSVGKQIDIALSESARAGEQLKIQFSGKLNLPADQRLVMPSLHWNGAQRSDRYLLLPTLVGDESITWHRVGLRRQSLPLPLVEFATQGEPAHPFLIEQDEFEAEQRNSQLTMRNALVRHAKVTGFVDVSGTFVGTAELFVQPGRATSCAIRLPEDSELFQLVVGDQPARRERRADGSWRLPVGPPFLPQRILVSYRCAAKLVGDQLKLDPPQVLLADQALPTEKIWWQIRGPLNLTLRANSKQQSVRQRQMVEDNYQASLQVVHDAFSQALELSRDEGRAWAGVWQGVIQRAEHEMQAYRAENDDQIDLAAAAETLLSMADAFAEGEKVEPVGLHSLTYPITRTPILGVAARGNRYHFVSDSAGKLELTMTLGTQHRWWQWFAAAVLMIAGVAIVMRLRLHPESYHELCYWPHCLAIVFGLVWWLCLKPSVLGLLVILLALVSLAVKRWRAYRLDKRVGESSPVVMQPS